MTRQYANILPKKILNDMSADDPEKHDLKRRRTGPIVACDRCRSRKIRCNGERPVCSNCQGKADRCTYRDEGALSTESSKLVREIFRGRNSLTIQESSKLVRSVTHEHSAWAIIQTLRGRVDGDARSIDNISQIQPNESGPSASSHEFQRQNLIAYPFTSVPSKELLTTQPYQDLTKPISRATTASTQRHDSPTISSSALLTPRSTLQTPPKQRTLCDARLVQLEISKWTDVDIDNDLAARCISLYLETDHPLLAPFDPDQFLEHLISGQTQFCSSLLVNALLYWACQMYSVIDVRVDSLALQFCAKAEALWAAEHDQAIDSTTNIAAAEFLSLGYLGHGRDHAVVKYSAAAAHMGARMGLFKVAGHTSPPVKADSTFTDEVERSRSYAAWGIFNWLTLMSLFYHQPGDICPSSSPPLKAPCDSICDFMGHTFPWLCRFWAIIREVISVYQTDIDDQPWGSSASIQFAEFKFRELLAWSNNLPPQLFLRDKNPHHVHVMHLWLHAAILDIFRPFSHDETTKNTALKTFSGHENTPKTVVEASHMQMKALIVSYRLNYASSSFTILWHTALIYVANDILQHTEDESWYSYLLLCLYGYQCLSRSWRVARTVSKGLLSLTLRKTDISANTVQRLLSDLESIETENDGDDRAPFLVDLDFDEEDYHSATAEHLASQLEGNMILRQYTNVFDEVLN